jgi:hypothetical protein
MSQRHAPRIHRACSFVLGGPAAARLVRGGGFLIVLALLLSAATALAQPKGAQSKNGNRDPAQFMARITERYRSQLVVTNDEEWKIIEQRIETVLQAERELRNAEFTSSSRNGATNGKKGLRSNSGRVRGNAPGGSSSEADSDVTGLRKLIESKAPPGQIRAKLARVREMFKQKQMSLDTAREDLRSVLSVRQEAIAVLIGLLR